MSTATIEPRPLHRPLVLPARQPMLSPLSWRVLIIVVMAVLALVPICSMLVPDGSPFHLSAYALTLVGKIMCYAIGSVGARPGLGLLRNPEPGTQPVLCAGRLHDGHVPDAIDRARGGLS